MKREPTKRIPGQPRVTPRGATRQKKRQGRSPEFWRWARRVTGAMLAIALIGGSVYGLSEPLQRWFNRPVTEVSVEGSFRYMSRERVEALLSRELDEDFFQLDLSRVKAALEEEPWVERAALRRRWPDQLQVKIYEEEPIARWGESGFLNRRGEILTVADDQMLAHLPRLDGPDRDAERMMERYQDLAQMLRSRRLTIRSLSSDDKGAWQLTLGDGVTLNIGRDRVLEKMRRFVSVFEQQLQERWQEVETVDLRYQSGVAVSWKKERENGQ